MMKNKKSSLFILFAALVCSLFFTGCVRYDSSSGSVIIKNTSAEPSQAVSEPVSGKDSEKSGAPTPAAELSPTAVPDKTAAPSPAAVKTPSVSPSPASGTKAPAKTPSPTPSKTPESSLTDLKEEVEELIEGYDGTWSVYCKRMDTEESFCINNGSRISASLIKLYIFGAVMEAVEAGEMDFDYYSEPLELMIEYSDNDSANLLIEDLGFENINDFIDRQGFKDTELYRYMLEENDLENYTSTKDCGDLLERVLKGTYVSEEASDLLLYHLKNQYTLYKIPAGVPEDVSTASKSGELDDAQHDAAIVYSPACTYILVIMSNDLEPYFEGAEDAINEICEISETVYNYVQHKLPTDN